MSTIGESVDVAATLSDDVIGSDEANVEEGNSVKESEASDESVDVSLVSVDAAFAPSSKVVSVDEAGKDVVDACALDSVNEISDSRLTAVVLVKSPADDPVVVVASLE